MALEKVSKVEIVNFPEEKKSSVQKLFLFVLLALVVETFILGSMWSKIKFLEKSASSVQTAAPVAQAAAAQQVAPQMASLEQVKGLFDKNVIKFGDKNAKNLFVEVADPSCPYCHAAAGVNKELSVQMGPQFKLVSDGGTYVSPVVEMRKLVDAGKAAFVWIYSNGHGAGEVTTKALYCAYDQGKFWEAHNSLMSNTGYSLINSDIKNDKTKYGVIADFLKKDLSSQKLKECLDSDKYDTRLSEEQQLSSSLGVQGTPGFFINEKNFSGAYNWKDMESSLK